MWSPSNENYSCAFLISWNILFIFSNSHQICFPQCRWRRLKHWHGHNMWISASSMELGLGLSQILLLVGGWILSYIDFFNICDTTPFKICVSKTFTNSVKISITITIGLSGPYHEDSEVILVCEAGGGKPTPQVGFGWLWLWQIIIAIISIV